MTAERVERAIAATRACSTARMRHRVELEVGGRAVASEQTGVADFANVRHAIEDEYERIVDRGEAYDRKPGGRWTGPRELGRSVVPHIGGPHWPLDLLGGTVRAEAAGDGRIVCTVDAVEADARAEVGLAVPPGVPLRELRALVVDVWIGSGGLVERVRVHVSNGWREFEFWDFGVPAPVEPPAPGLVDDDALDRLGL